MILEDEDGTLIIGLAEILSGRLPFVTLRARCSAQAYCLPANDVCSIFTQPHSGCASASLSTLSMRLVAQGTAVYLRRRTLHLTSLWERIVLQLVHKAAATAALAATDHADIPGDSATMAAPVGRGDECQGRGWQVTSSTRVRMAVGLLFENGGWSPRQEDGGG
jgi:hypothetical protein